MEFIPCPVCKSPPKKRKLLLNDYRICSDRPTTYLVCTHCKTVYQHPVLSLNEISKHYPPEYSYHTSKKKPSVAQKIFSPLIGMLMRPLARYAPDRVNADISILDVGCACGDFLGELKKRGAQHLYGIEVSSTASEIACSRGLNITHTSLTDFSADMQYDIITLNQVFEHFSDPHAALAKLSILMKQDGLLVMSMPSNRSMAAYIFGKFWPGYDAPRHYFTYNPKAISYLCRKQHLKIIKIKHISRPSQFTGSFHYVCNSLLKRKVTLENSFFRRSILLDLLFFPLSYVLNACRLGDNIEIYIAKQFFKYPGNSFKGGDDFY